MFNPFKNNIIFLLQVIDSVIQSILESHVGPMPPIRNIRKNVSFILQNGHATVTYPRPFLPNVAEIACIHCKPAKPLPKVHLQ